MPDLATSTSQWVFLATQGGMAIALVLAVAMCRHLLGKIDTKDQQLAESATRLEQARRDQVEQAQGEARAHLETQRTIVEEMTSHRQASARLLDYLDSKGVDLDGDPPHARRRA